MDTLLWNICKSRDIRQLLLWLHTHIQYQKWHSQLYHNRDLNERGSTEPPWVLCISCIRDFIKLPDSSLDSTKMDGKWMLQLKSITGTTYDSVTISRHKTFRMTLIMVLETKRQQKTLLIDLWFSCPSPSSSVSTMADVPSFVTPGNQC